MIWFMYSSVCVLIHTPNLPSLPLHVSPLVTIGLGTSQMTHMVKNLPANVGDVGLIPESGRSPGGGNVNPLQYSFLENSMDRGSWCPWGHKRIRYNLMTE